MKNRSSNGYLLIYMPKHPAAYKRGNYAGYVYEHVVVAESFLGRRLRKDEEVHHLNGDRRDNRKRNLLVLMQSQHSKLHAWILRGAPGIERLGMNGVNSKKPKCENTVKCMNSRCHKIVADKKFCSQACRSEHALSRRPSKSVLKREMQDSTLTALGKKYGVTPTGIKLWARDYGIVV